MSLIEVIGWMLVLLVIGLVILSTSPIEEENKKEEK
tara:strand:+ start:1652 stop:1759 length:108 start_codon:yes stop_codon:yes gene_type:complete